MTRFPASEMVAIVTVTALASLALVTVAYLVILEVLFYRLRKSHADHYREIGEPSLFLNNSFSKSRATVRYLLDRGYLCVSDERVERLGNYSRRLLIAGWSLFGFAILMYVLFGFMVGAFR